MPADPRAADAAHDRSTDAIRPLARRLACPDDEHARAGRLPAVESWAHHTGVAVDAIEAAIRREVGA